jgi:hypothetical protein
MEIEVDYYKKLYKSTNPDNDKLKKYIENTKVHNKLSNNESEKCEGEITIEECTNAISEKSCIFFSFFDPFYSTSDLSPFCFFRVQFI